MEHVTGKDRAAQILAETEILEPKALMALETLLRRRLNGEPLDHIMGHQGFFGRRFKVDGSVLTPRPETELLVSAVLADTKAQKKARLLDLGTGSGAIIISILAERPGFTGLGIDASDEALRIADENAHVLGVKNRLDLLTSNWFEAVKGRFDIIVSNPPYITDKAMGQLEIEVSEYDPKLALSGGPDGLNAYRIIAEQTGNFLKTQGRLYLEIGYDQGESVPSILDLNGFKEIEVFKDLSGNDRLVTAIAAK